MLFFSRYALTVQQKTPAGRVFRTACSCASTAPESTAPWEYTSASLGTLRWAVLWQFAYTCDHVFLHMAPGLIWPYIFLQIYRVRLQLELVSASMYASWRQCQCGKSVSLPVNLGQDWNGLKTTIWSDCSIFCLVQLPAVTWADFCAVWCDAIIKFLLPEDGFLPPTWLLH